MWSRTYCPAGLSNPHYCTGNLTILQPRAFNGNFPKNQFRVSNTKQRCCCIWIRYDRTCLQGRFITVNRVSLKSLWSGISIEMRHSHNFQSARKLCYSVFLSLSMLKGTSYWSNPFHGSIWLASFLWRWWTASGGGYTQPRRLTFLPVQTINLSGFCSYQEQK